MEWHKVNSSRWLEGSIRVDLTPAERSVWQDLLCLASLSRERGRIERSRGIPYTREEIASRLIIDVGLLQSTVDKCIREGRLQEDNGSLIITNWDKYQEVPERKQHLTPQARELADRKKAVMLARRFPKDVSEAITDMAEDGSLERRIKAQGGG